MKRLTIACLAAAASVALAGCGSGDDEATPAITTTPTETTITATTTTETATEPAAPEPAVFRMVVRDGRPVGGIARPKVQKGEWVTLVVLADIPGDVHLHGYDLERPVAPGSPARMRFEATIPGRFEIELHAHPEIHVGELTVEP